MKTKILAIIAVLTVFFALSCENPESTGGKGEGGHLTGEIPAELVAKWHTSQKQADDEDPFVTLEFNEDHDLLYMGVNNQLTINVEGNLIRIYRPDVHTGIIGEIGTVKYAVTGTSLNFSNVTGEEILPTAIIFYCQRMTRINTNITHFYLNS